MEGRKSSRQSFQYNRLKCAIQREMGQKVAFSGNFVPWTAGRPQGVGDLKRV